MNNKSTLKFLILFSAGLFFYGCGGEDILEQTKVRVRRPQRIKFEKPPEIEIKEYKYTGMRYRSPFLPDGTARAIDAAAEHHINFDELKVTGYFSTKKERYVILSGVEEFYIVKQGRLFNENEEEVRGVAAIIKEDKIILITEKDTIYELAIPQ